MLNKMSKMLAWISLILFLIILGEMVYGVFYPNQTPAWLGVREIVDANGDIVSSAKTLWDLADLLIMPLALAIIAYLFSRSEKQMEEKRTDERIQEDALKQYVEQIGKLMLDNQLLTSEENAPVRQVARTLTRVVLFNVNAKRKGVIVRFLKEADLINAKKTIISLAGADFRDVDLHRAGLQNLNFTNANLIGANFEGASLEGANLMNANLGKANLKSTNLRRANLKEVDFSEADLSQANLDDAKLIKANLKGSILKGAKLRGDLTGIKLEGAIYDNDTKWTEGFNPNLSGAFFN